MNPLETDHYDFDVEASIIGWCLTDQSLPAKLFSLLPDHFYSSCHRDIWKAICKLRRSGDPITPFTIAPFIDNKEAFEDCGGVYKYLAGTISASLIHPFPESQEKYLIGLAKKRSLQFACIRMNGSEEAAAAVAAAARDVLDVNCPEEFFDNYEITVKILDNLKQNIKPISTGISKLDEAMDGGIYPKKSYGFAARKKMGKTILAGTISHNLNLQGIKHLFICGEMSPQEIQQRSLCRIVDAYPSAFRSNYGKSYDFEKKIAQAAHDMPRNIIYRNAPGLTFDDLKNMVENAINIHQVKGIILDYWQLVGGKTKGQSDTSHLDEVAQWIADYCRKKDIWSIVMAQINQEGNTRGGEGIRLAFDQVYELKAPGDDPSRSGRWLEMRDTRYTKWLNIGSENSPDLTLEEKGLYFRL